MKKISKLMMMLILVSAIFGCKKDEKKPGGGFMLPPAQYEVKLDGEILIKNNDGFRHISESTNGINSAVDVTSSGSLTETPEENISITNIEDLGVGDTKEVNVAGQNSSKKIEVTITKSFSNREIYGILEGTITREADNKISFSATKLEIYKDGQASEASKILTGYIASDIIKKLGQSDENK